MNNNFLNAVTRFTDCDLIEAILGNFFIVDYGIIKAVNADKTINVLHAKQQKMMNGETLPEMETKNIEVLTLSGTGFSLTWDIQKGDKVLLLGLKTPVAKTGDITSPEETKSYLHYSRETLKALPMCVFNNKAKVKAEIKKGKLSVTAEDDIEFECNNHKIKAKQKIELNGNSKQLVTWAELNTALNNLIVLLNTHTHTCAAPSSPSSPPVTPMTINIGAAKTTTVVTGG